MTLTHFEVEKLLKTINKQLEIQAHSGGDKGHTSQLNCDENKIKSDECNQCFTNFKHKEGT